jgi:hypothetical protein
MVSVDRSTVNVDWARTRPSGPGFGLSFGRPGSDTCQTGRRPCGASQLLLGSFTSAAHGGLGGAVLWTTKRVHGGPHPPSSLLSTAHSGSCAPSGNGARWLLLPTRLLMVVNNHYKPSMKHV